MVKGIAKWQVWFLFLTSLLCGTYSPAMYRTITQMYEIHILQYNEKCFNIYSKTKNKIIYTNEHKNYTVCVSTTAHLNIKLINFSFMS